jgi:hypothetical protein
VIVVVVVVVVVAQLSLIWVCIIFSRKILQFDLRLWSVFQKLSERLEHLVKSVFWEVKRSKANL